VRRVRPNRELEIDPRNISGDAQGIVSVIVSEEQMQSVELKLQPAVRDRRFSYPRSGRPLARRDSHKGLRTERIIVDCPDAYLYY
jgi:hypothetical protein